MPRTESGYGTYSEITFTGKRVENVQLTDGVIAGNLTDVPIDSASWVDPPHVALANMRAWDASGTIVTEPREGLSIDPGAAVQFVKKFGFLRPYMPTGSKPSFELDGPTKNSLAGIARFQQKLRAAWRTSQFLLNGEPIRASEMSLTGYKMRFVDGKLELSTDDLWKFIEALFNANYNNGELGVCANFNNDNPKLRCPHPYFIKNHGNQQACQGGPGDVSSCTQLLRKRSKLNYWNKKGKFLPRVNPNKGKKGAR